MTEGESKLDRHSLKGPVEEKGTPHPEKSPTQWKEQPNWKNLPMQISVSQSSEKQSENQTDHLNYWHSHQETEMLGWWLSTKTSSPEVSPLKGAGVGSVETAWGGLGTGLSGLMGQRLPGRLESRASVGGREQYTKGWEVESHIRGNLGEELDLQERQGASVGEGREYSLHHSELTGLPAIRKLCFPVHSSPPTPHGHAGPGAACHPRGLASILHGSLPLQGLSLPWPACPLEGLHPRRAAPNTASPLQEPLQPRKDRTSSAGT